MIHAGFLRFPAAPEAVAHARAWLTLRMGPAHPARGESVLLLSEAMTNGIEHGGGLSLRVSYELFNDHVKIAVVDGGSEDSKPHVVEAASTDEHGRGMKIMDELAEAWGYATTPDGGTQVWFTVAF